MEDILDDWEKEKTPKFYWFDYVGLCMVLPFALLIWFAFFAWWQKPEHKNTNP